MRMLATYVAVISFALIGVIALTEGNMRVGVATVCLAVANGLLLL